MLPIDRYFDAGTKKFGFWVFIKPTKMIDKVNKKKFVKTIEQTLGPIGLNWQYQIADERYVLKLNSEKDAVFFMLKFKKD